MNKYQEALSEVIRMCAQSDELFPTEEVEALQKLVDRATPKKLKIRAFNEAKPWDCADYFVEREACPLCGHKLLDKDPYCYICGQRLDWSKE